MFAERFAVRKVLDRAVKIGVSAFVAAEQIAYKRQHMREVQVIPTAYQWVGGVGEFQNHQFATMPQYAIHLA